MRKAIKGGTVYTMAGKPIENGIVLIEKGKIIAVGHDVEIPDGTEVFDFSGMTITPGFIDAHTHLDGFGIKSGGDSNDTADPVCPHLDLLDEIDPKTESISRTRLGGFTSCCVLPGSANIIGGRGAVIKLDGKMNIRDSAYGPVQIKMALGENPRRTHGERKGCSPMSRMGNAEMMRSAMREAHGYYVKKTSGESVSYDKRWEAMFPAFSGEAVIHVHCHRMDDILTAIRILEPYGVKFSIDHVTEGHLVSDILAEKNVNCIVGPISCGPQKQETWHCTPACAAVLEKAGVENIALTVDGDTHVCALPIDVGICMAFGFSKEAAFRSVTASAAKILGVIDRVGTLEAGKDADIAVFNGFPFENKTLCRGVFIDGKFYNAEEAY